MLGALRDEVVPEVLGGRPAVTPEPATAVDETAPAVPDEADDAVPDAPVDDTGAVSTPVAETPALDEVCAAAVDLARAAAVEEAGGTVGEHLGAEPEDAHTVTHAFAATDPAYVGWRWAVTVARAEGTDVVTVDEVVLLPGSDALLAPAWVPYSERVQPEDLEGGALLPPAPDDPRLVPAWTETEEDLAGELFGELFLGRPRVLSAEGRLDAAERWYEGDHGPTSPRAVAAPGQCGGCGFLVPLGGSLARAFGACANAQAPDDGRVVSLDHGCGAHSETPVELTHVATAELVVDEVEFDFEERGEAEADTPAAPVDPLPDPADEQQAEELGHS